MWGVWLQYWLGREPYVLNAVRAEYLHTDLNQLSIGEFLSVTKKSAYIYKELDHTQVQYGHHIAVQENAQRLHGMTIR